MWASDDTLAEGAPEGRRTRGRESGLAAGSCSYVGPVGGDSSGRERPEGGAQGEGAPRTWCGPHERRPAGATPEAGGGLSAGRGGMLMDSGWRCAWAGPCGERHSPPRGSPSRCAVKVAAPATKAGRIRVLGPRGPQAGLWCGAVVRVFGQRVFGPALLRAELLLLRVGVGSGGRAR